MSSVRKWIREITKTPPITRKYYKYTFSIRLITGEIINTDSSFYSLWGFDDYVRYDIMEKKGIKIGEVFYNSKNIISVTHIKTESKTKDFRSEWDTDFYID